MSFSIGYRYQKGNFHSSLSRVPVNFPQLAGLVMFLKIQEYAGSLLARLMKVIHGGRKGRHICFPFLITAIIE